MPEPSILDERLAEIDRRLRMIQSGLESVPDPAVEPPPEAADPDPPPAPTRLRAGPPEHAPAGVGSAASLGSGAAASPVPGVGSGAGDSPVAGVGSAVLDPQALAAGLRELTTAQERLLAVTRGLLAQPPLAHVELDAGPFADTTALREFQHSLVELPEVRDVVVREYAGTARAVLEVQLRAPIS